MPGEGRLADAAAVLDRIGVAIMTASPDDMRKLGEILSGFEELGRLAEKEGLTDLRDGARVGDALASALIFQDAARRYWEKGMELLSRTASCCQKACRGGAGTAAELRKIREAAVKRLKIDLPSNPGDSEAPVGDPGTAEDAVALDQERDLYVDFVRESIEHLEDVEIKMVDLECNPKDAEIINAVFRAFHTIKGVSGFLNLTDINRLAHSTETLLDMARRGDLEAAGPVIDVVFEAVDAMKEMVRDVSERVSAGDASRPLRDIRALAARIERLQVSEAEDGRDGDREGKEQGSRCEPPAKMGEILVDQGKITRKELTEALREQEGKADRPPLGKILVDEDRVAPKDVAQALRVQKTGSKLESQDIRVDVRKLDGVVDMVGELVIAQSLVRNDPAVQAIDSQQFFRNMAQLGRVTTEMQRIAMSLRMVPIRNTFQKMSRLVRDLARKSGKEVSLVTEGDETEIDRNMVEEIHDPLVHLIRNALDHGIEVPEKRVAAGKSACGTVTLRAYHHGGNVVIEVEDDGRGLDSDRILAKAKDRGLAPPEAALSESEIFALIFEPGFSTAEKVTDISGRGVGMDVVRKNVEKLRGTIETRSRPGEGSTFSLKFPLTLAIIEGIVIRVGTQRYVMPTNSVLEAVRPAAGEYCTVERTGELIKVRGELLPLVRLHSLFSVEGARRDPLSALVVVAEAEGQRRAVLVDELLGKQEVVIKNLGEGMTGIRGISGGAIMGDGRVGLILDVAGIFSLTGRVAAAAAR